MKSPRFELAVMPVPLKNDSAITVRRKQPEDGHCLGQMLADCSERTSYFFHPYPLTYESGVMVAADESILCLVAFDDQRAAVGYAWIKRARDPASLGMVVRDGWQGLGIGRILMEQILVEAKTLGKKAIALTVLQDNKPALNLYQRFGFTVEEELQNQNVPAYRMKVNL